VYASVVLRTRRKVVRGSGSGSSSSNEKKKKKEKRHNQLGTKLCLGSRQSV
jgi:hypothetical protein